MRWPRSARRVDAAHRARRGPVGGAARHSGDDRRRQRARAPGARAVGRPAHRAGRALTRLVEAHPQLRDELASESELLDAVVAVTRRVALAARGARTRRRRARDAARAGAPRAAERRRLLVEAHGGVARATTRRAALRRWKHRQIVRIAGRDLLGIADLRAVGAELAARRAGVSRRRARDRRRPRCRWP